MIAASELARNMIGAAAEAAAGRWTEIKAVATQEFALLAQRIVRIEKQYLAKEIDQDTAETLFDLARSHLASVLALLSTMLKKATQAIINAALDVIKVAVNKAIGFTLIA